MGPDYGVCIITMSIIIVTPTYPILAAPRRLLAVLWAILVPQGFGAVLAVLSINPLQIISEVVNS